MSAPLEFDIHVTTYSANRYYAGMHWAKRKRISDVQKEQTRLSWLGAFSGDRTKWPKPPATVTFIRRSARVMDDDNLRMAMKAIRDTIAELLGVDDGDPSVRWEYAQEPGRGGARVTVRLAGPQDSPQTAPSPT